MHTGKVYAIELIKDARLALEAYPDGSGFFLHLPRGGRIGLVVADAPDVDTLERWAYRNGAKSVTRV